MMRRHAVHPPPHHHYQQQQLPQPQQQPLDLIAGVVSERQRQLGGSGLAVTDDGQLESRKRRWQWFSGHWQSIVCVIFAVSLLADATVVSVIWWQWKPYNCSTTQPHCPVDHAVRLSVAPQIQGGISDKRIVNWTSLQLLYFSSRFECQAANESVTVRRHGIHFIYSRASFGSRDEKTVFRHEIQEVKGNNQPHSLLHNVVEKQCRSSDATCHSSLLMSALWLKAGYKIYVTTEPASLLRAEFCIAFISQ